MGLGTAIRELDDALNGMENSIDRIINDSHPAIESILSDIKCEFDDLANALLYFFEERDANILDDLIEEKRLISRCENLIKQCYTIFPQNINYITRQYLRANDENKSILLSIKDALKSIFEGCGDSLQTVNRIIQENQTHHNTFSMLLNDSYKNYCKHFRGKELDSIKKEIRDNGYKPYAGATYTQEIWGKALDTWFDALNYAVKISGRMYELESDIKKYRAYNIIELSEQYALIQKILDAAEDDSLFDFDKCNGPFINLFDKLTIENVDVFLQLILRHDIIVCEMNSNLKKEFDAWYNIKPAQSEDSYRIENLSEDARGWLLRKEIYPKLAKLLNDEVKPYVESTGTKATWDSFHFLFKLFGIVKPRFSRKNFAILVTQIVPGLGESSALESMMEQSHINWPQIKGFEIDNAKSSVATALRPFYDKFNNLCK